MFVSVFGVDCSFFGEVFGTASGVAFVAGSDPVGLVCGVCSAINFDEVVDGCGFGSPAPMAYVVVLEELCSGRLVAGLV